MYRKRSTEPGARPCCLFQRQDLLVREPETIGEAAQLALGFQFLGMRRESCRRYGHRTHLPMVDGMEFIRDLMTYEGTDARSLKAAITGTS